MAQMRGDKAARPRVIIGVGLKRGDALMDLGLVKSFCEQLAPDGGIRVIAARPVPGPQLRGGAVIDQAELLAFPDPGRRLGWRASATG